MKKTVTILSTVALGLIGLCGIAVILIYFYFRLSLPAADGSAQLSTLQQPVRVIRDRYAIAHIEAENLTDVASAQGFVHAQERLWQMEMFRLIGQGRLAALFGESALDTDIFMRTLDLAGYAQASFNHLQPQSQAILRAYASGVNAYLEQRGSLLKPFPPEFVILRHRPEPWEPWHGLLTIKLMDLTLSANLSQEIRRLILAARGLSPQQIDDLVRYVEVDRPPLLPDLREIYDFSEQPAPSSAGAAESINAPKRLSGSQPLWPINLAASNNWVVSGQQTGSGRVLLANDPHLTLTAPSTWYLNHLSWQHQGRKHNLIGATIPSIPLILVGRNDRVAWGLTTSYLDSQDLFIEKTHPDHPEQYLTPNGWQDFTTRQVAIAVKGQPTATVTVRATRHGPVLPDNYRNLNHILPQGHVAALRWTSLTTKDTTFDALLQMTQADSVKQFMRALQPMVSPMQTIVAGDMDGNIGLIAPALIVQRNPDNLIAGRAPVPGWLAKYDWTQLLTFEDWPQQFNPPQGWLFSANYKFVDATYPHHLTYDWGRPFRHQRIAQLLSKSAPNHNIATMKTMFADDYSAPLTALRDLTVPLVSADAEIGDEVLERLRAWNGRMRADEMEPLLMTAWYRALIQAVLADELDDDLAEITDEQTIEIILAQLRGETATNWCDDQQTAAEETCAPLIRQSLATAITQLRRDYGNDWKNWRWGAAHVALNKHRPFAAMVGLAELFNITIESSGGAYTLLRGHMNLDSDQPYYNRAASTYRAIYDFADLEHSLFIQNTGQSGHFLSSHYDDFASPWAQVSFVPMWTDPTLYRPKASGTWQLTGAAAADDDDDSR